MHYIDILGASDAAILPVICRMDSNSTGTVDRFSIHVTAVQLSGATLMSGGVYPDVVAVVGRIGVGGAGVYTECAAGTSM